ncbi:hypothetical protein Q6332_29310, partial [Klebsiella pneumoniae]|uniref:hypothetical protein n=1 Tax=Klebsiella pneumoniae TaxID=573 RepID=UPI0027321054
NKKSFIAIAAAHVALAPLSSHAHDGVDHAASAPAAKAADGHAHSHGDSDASGVAGKAAKFTLTVNVEMTEFMGLKSYFLYFFQVLTV